MKLHHIKQRSPQWFDLKVGKISGSRFGQCISGRKNRLIYDVLNESMNGYIEQDDYIDEDMQFGLDNEPVARQLYSEQSGINWQEIGAIESDTSSIHIASPDGISPDQTKILEIKCTQNGAIHLQRFIEGIDTSYLPQVINYFAIDDQIKEVHWVSYCPYRPERPLVVFVVTREMFQKDIEAGRKRIEKISTELETIRSEFVF